MLILLPLVIFCAIAGFFLGIACYPLFAFLHSPAGDLEAALAAQATTLKIGFVVVILGVLLPLLVSLPRLRGASTTALVTTGAFAMSRHPMYISNVLVLYPGIGLMFNNWLVSIVLTAGALAYFLPHIRIEEELLAERHGDYRAYQKKVGLLFSLGRIR